MTTPSREPDTAAAVEPAVTIDEINQEATAYPRVAVDVGPAPIRVSIVPNKKGTVTTDTVGVAPTRILNDDPKRALAQIVSDEAFHVMNMPTGTASLWPANVPLVITHGSAVYAKAVSGESSLTVVTEFLAD